MKPFTVPAGTQVFLGAPAKPMPMERAAAIGSVADSVNGVVEAHLPQCFVPGVMAGPAQVLVLVVHPSADPQRVLKDLGPGLNAILPKETHIDVWPMSPQSTLLADVRRANCRIGKSPTDTATRLKP